MSFNSFECNYNSIKKVIILIFFPINLFAFSALENNEAKIASRYKYQFTIASTLFATTSYFDNNKTNQSLLNGAVFKMLDTDFGARFSYWKDLETTIKFKIRSNSSSIESTTLANSAANTGIESSGILLKYLIYSSSNTLFSIGIHYLQTLYSNLTYTSSQTVPTDQIVLGDAGNEYGVDFYTTYQNSPFWKNNFKLSYNQPPNELSTEIIYKLETIYLKYKINFIAGLEGIKSLNNDPYTKFPSLKPQTSNGQTHLFNSINREKLSPYIGGIYSYNNFDFFTKIATIVSGRSTDKGNEFTIGLNFNYSSDNTNIVDTKPKNDLNQKTSNETYQQPIEEINKNPEVKNDKLNPNEKYDALITRVSKKKFFATIDKGEIDHIKMDDKFKIFQLVNNEKKYIIAYGTVVQIGPNWTIIKIIDKIPETELRVGFYARKYIEK